MRSARGFVRTGVVLAALVMMVGIAVPNASAATGRAVTGPVVGSAPFDFNSCSLAHQTYLGKITTPGGVIAKLKVDVCVDLGASNCTVSGTFLITKGTGKVSGTTAGTIKCIGTGPAPFDYTLHVRKSAPRLATVGQNLHFRGTWHSDMVSDGPFKGKITLT